MGDYIFGIVLFAIGIAVTIGLHEWGHMRAALATGMVVRRFYIGFGPTLFKFRGKAIGDGSVKDLQRGMGQGIEYGFKLLPLGGFCDIAGMTAVDELTPAEQPLAMWRKSAVARIFVLLGGIIMNLILAFVLLYSVAVSVGLPKVNPQLNTVVGETMCVPATRSAQNPAAGACEGAGPAAAAGIVAGDTITAIDGQKVAGIADVRNLVLPKGGQTVTVTVQKADGSVVDLPVPVTKVTVTAANGETTEMGAIGIAAQTPTRDQVMDSFNPATAVFGAAKFEGYLLQQTVVGLAKFPAKLPGVAASIFGAERDAESPMSVVGASRVGGELVEHREWPSFVMMLASLNIFLALFNLLPLPPLDGGHIAVVLWEKLRNGVRRLLGKTALGPADYAKLMPLTIAVSGVLLVVGVLTIAADVVNPIRLF